MAKLPPKTPTEPDDVRMYVRLKPYNPRRGAVRMKHTDGPSGQMFTVQQGWYKVSSDVASRLERVKQYHGDDESSDAFDVCTRDEALAIDKREKADKVRRDAVDAHDLTSADLRRGTVASLEAGTLSRAPVETDDESPEYTGPKGGGDLSTGSLPRRGPGRPRKTPVDERNEVRARRDRG